MSAREPVISDPADGMFCAAPHSAKNSEPAARCGARTRDGSPCKRAVVPGRTKCRNHGGMSKRGSEHGRFKSGLYSKCLSRDLKADYERLLAHPGLLSVKCDVAALRVRLQQLAGRLETGESVAWLTDVRKALAELRAAADADDDESGRAALARIEGLVNGELDREGAWNDFAALVERVSLLAAREHKMIVEERLTLSLEDARTLVASITAAVMAHVPDPATRAKIAAHVNRLRVLETDEVAQIANQNPTTVHEQSG